MPALDDLRLQLTAKLTTAARTIGDEWERDLKATSPVDTGNMRDNTATKVSFVHNGVEIEATVDTDYAEMVARGTRGPYPIVPVNRKALAFPSGDGVVIVASVNHPGIRNPNDWWDESIRRLPDLAQRAWRGA